MTEEDARRWLSDHAGVSREKIAALERYVDLLRAETERQNLIAASTRDRIWARHIVDSAQLVMYARGATGPWVDVGSGAGLPGIVTAILTGLRTVLIEPRRLRAEFLVMVAQELDLTNVAVQQTSSQRTEGVKASVILARALAFLSEIFAISRALATEQTVWILPKGRNALNELESAKQDWHGVFHVEQSLTDPESSIIIAREVRPR